jgi:hypothetical protein
MNEWTGSPTFIPGYAVTQKTTLYLTHTFLNTWFSTTAQRRCVKRDALQRQMISAWHADNGSQRLGFQEPRNDACVCVTRHSVDKAALLKGTGVYTSRAWVSRKSLVTTRSYLILSHCPSNCSSIFHFFPSKLPIFLSHRVNQLIIFLFFKIMATLSPCLRFDNHAMTYRIPSLKTIICMPRRRHFTL